MAKNDWPWLVVAGGAVLVGAYLIFPPTREIARSAKSKSGGGFSIPPRSGGSGSCIRLLKDRPWGNPSDDISVLTSTGTIASGASISAWLRMMRCDYILFDEIGCTTCGITNCNPIQPNDNPYVELRLVPESVGNRWPLLQSSHPPAPDDPQAPLYHWSRISWGRASGHGWSGEYYWWGNFPTYAQDGRPTAGCGWHLYWAFASLNAQSLPVPLDQTCDDNVWFDSGGWYCLSVARNLVITGDACPLPPSLTITSPYDGYSTLASSVQVYGTTESGAIVNVNGTHVGYGPDFSCIVDLSIGANLITVKSTGCGGITTVAITVTRVTRTEPTGEPPPDLPPTECDEYGYEGPPCPI